MAADEFIRGVQALALAADRRAGLVVVAIEAVAGSLAGERVEVGVSAEELAAWPLVPPHWVHFSDEVVLPNSNRQPSDQLPGWSRYSRPLKTRVDVAASPSRAWVAHARALLSELTRA